VQRQRADQQKGNIVPMILYGRKSTGSFAVEAALALAKAPHTVVPIDTSVGEQHSPSFAAINPMGQIPALVLDDGTVLTESVAIVLHLANLYPDAGLAPAPGTAGSAKFLRWMVFMAVNIYEADLRFFYPERYTDAAGVTATKAAAMRHLQRDFAVMEEHALQPGPFISGATMTIADIYLAMLVGWYPDKLTLPKINHLRDLVAAHHVIAPLWAAHAM
jgi:glutathione S-transferase